jgi:hypothetical protein
MAVLPQEGWSLKPVPERPLTFFPEGKAVADWRAFEDVFAGRVAVKGGFSGRGGRWRHWCRED